MNEWMNAILYISAKVALKYFLKDLESPFNCRIKFWFTKYIYHKVKKKSYFILDIKHGSINHVNTVVYEYYHCLNPSTMLFQSDSCTLASPLFFSLKPLCISIKALSYTWDKPHFLGWNCLLEGKRNKKKKTRTNRGGFHLLSSDPLLSECHSRMFW